MDSEQPSSAQPEVKTHPEKAQQENAVVYPAGCAPAFGCRRAILVVYAKMRHRKVAT